VSAGRPIRWRALLTVLVLAVATASPGCGRFRGPPDPIDALRQPPNVIGERAGDAVAAPEQAAPRGRLLTGEDEPPVLVIEESFFAAWRSVAQGLDRAGFTVEDRDRSRGEYFIRYDLQDAGERRRGFFSRLAFWRRGETADSLQPYIVRVRHAAGAARVTIEDDEGQPAQREAAQQVLSLLQEHLR
jgi:outer membrane protein assembly factor BamC